MQLSCHLKTDYPWDPIKVLTALDLHTISTGDAYIEILSD